MSMLQIPMSEREKEALEKRVSEKIHREIFSVLGTGFSAGFIVKIINIKPPEPLLSETAVFGILAVLCFLSVLLSYLKSRKNR